MKRSELERIRRALMSTARASAPSQDVPEGFEQRVLARLRRPAPAPDPLATWLHGLVRAAWASVALALAASAWLWVGTPTANGSATAPADLESALLAGMEDTDALTW